MATIETKEGADRWAVLLPDYWPPSLNETQRLHWSQIRKIKKDAVEMLSIFTLGRGVHGFTFAGKVTVQLYRLWGKGQRALDTDNLVGSVKPLVDGLRPRDPKSKQGGIGIIEDDHPDMLDLQVKQMKNGGPEQVALYLSMAQWADDEWDWTHWNRDELQTLILIFGKKEAQ